jgi:hypothetical protein
LGEEGSHDCCDVIFVCASVSVVVVGVHTLDVDKTTQRSVPATRGYICMSLC